jgi:hypothetical protein
MHFNGSFDAAIFCPSAERATYRLLRYKNTTGKYVTTEF